MPEFQSIHVIEKSTLDGDTVIAGDLTVGDDATPNNLSVTGSLILNTRRVISFDNDSNLGLSNEVLPTQNAVKTYVDNGLSIKADKTYVDNGLSIKADKTYVDNGLSIKADKTYVDNGLSIKADLNGSLGQNFNVKGLTVNSDLNVTCNVGIKGWLSVNDFLCVGKHLDAKNAVISGKVFTELQCFRYRHPFVHMPLFSFVWARNKEEAILLVGPTGVDITEVSPGNIYAFK